MRENGTGKWEWEKGWLAREGMGLGGGSRERGDWAGKGMVNGTGRGAGNGKGGWRVVVAGRVVWGQEWRQGKEGWEGG